MWVKPYGEIRLDLVWWLAEKTDCCYGNPAQKKREKRNRAGSLWYSLWISLRWLHCKVPESREETQSAEVFIYFFHRNIKFTAQQRGLDFALVQARHSSKVISYFATKALSTSLFSKRPGLEKQSATAGVWKLTQPSTLTRTSHEFVPPPFGFPGWFLSQMLVRREAKWHSWMYRSQAPNPTFILLLSWKNAVSWTESNDYIEMWLLSFHSPHWWKHQTWVPALSPWNYVLIQLNFIISYVWKETFCHRLHLSFMYRCDFRVWSV